MIDAAAFRKVMGSFATGVAVITTANDGMLHGMTANSLTALSLDPLLLLVCVDKKAHAHAELERCASFGINILGADQAHLSQLFAATAAPEKGCLRGAPYRLGAGGSPLLEGALAWLECRPVDRLAGGDHTIFVGEVTAAQMERPGAAPLVYFRGAYRDLTV